MRRLFLANGQALVLLLNFFPSFLLSSLYSTCLLSPLFSIPKIFKTQWWELYLKSKFLWHNLVTHLPLPYFLPHSITWEHCSLQYIMCIPASLFLHLFSPLFPPPLLFPFGPSPIYSSSPTFSMEVSICSFLKIVIIMKQCNCECLLNDSSVLSNLLTLYRLILLAIPRRLYQTCRWSLGLGKCYLNSQGLRTLEWESQR